MRLAAYHDSHGNIVGLAVAPSADAVLAEVVATSQPGLRMTEVKLPSGVKLDFENPRRVSEELEKLMVDHRVHNGALARKS